MNRLTNISCARIWNGRARIGLICYALASAACQQKPFPAVIPAPPTPCPPPGSRIVDDIALFAQCLGASLKTPPGIQGSNQWLDYGKVSVGPRTYGWLIVEPRASAKLLEAAWFIERSVSAGLVNRGNNVSLTICPDSLWPAAIENTLLTIAIQIDESDEKGQFLIYGGRMGQSSAPTGIRTPLVGVSRAEARRAAVALASEAVGEKIHNIVAPSDWADATPR